MPPKLIRVDPASVYVAAGNGLIRIPRRGGPWKILTAEDVTELRDVAVDPQGRIIFAHTAGIRMSSDRGKTWQEISSNLPRKYTEAIRADRSRPGVLIAGGEEGIWRSDNSGAAWRRAGASGVSIMRIEQSPHDPCFWLAATERAGVFSSTDCGQTFENFGRVGVDRNTYDIAFDPGNRNRIALAIWGTGVVVSEDSARLGRFADVPCQVPKSGPSHSIRPSPAASSPACTKKRSMSPKTPEYVDTRRSRRLRGQPPEVP